MPRSMISIALLALFASSAACQDALKPSPSILVYTKTAGYRHASIVDGLRALRALGDQHGFAVEHTEDPAWFRREFLDRFAAVVFLSTTGDVLDSAGQAALQGYVEAGGGFVGIHAASDTEYEWPWYGELVGTWFHNHPAQQNAVIRIIDPTHPSTAGLPDPWERFDEWYNFVDNPWERVHVLTAIDETSYEGGTLGEHHPMTWYREIGNARMWYTAMGHTSESFYEPAFRRHLLGGIRWASGLE